MTPEPENEAPTASVPLSHRSKTWGLGRWTMVVLVLVAFGLGTYDLGEREFWLDEAITAYISGLGWMDTIAYVRNAPWEHPPLYYLSLYPWQVLAGSSEFAFRFFSLFWGVLFIPLFYAVTKRLASERLALLAAMMATISPFMVTSSQEARMYTMLPTLALLALLSFWNGLERGDHPLWWLAYLIVMTLGTFTHYLFFMLWLVTTLYLLLDYLRRRSVRWWAIVTQSLPLLVVGVWVVFSPGLRDTLDRMVQGGAALSLIYRLYKIVPKLLLAEMDAQQLPQSAYILATAGWMLILLGGWWSKRVRVIGFRAWVLLMLTLVVPLTAALVVPYNVQGRHLGYTLIPGFVFMALGLLALHRRGTLALGAGILVVMLLSSLGLVTQYTSRSGSFGEAMAYIDRRGQPGDAVIISQPLQQHLVAYYNKQEWPISYVPSAPQPTAAGVEETLGALSSKHERLWLGPAGAWTADPEYFAEQWLVANAYQAEKVWFPDSSTVALYLTSRGELDPLEAGNWTWGGGQIGLYGVEASPLRVHNGDALRLRFGWRAGMGIDGRYEVSLRLVDDQGFVWAERRAEPCGGWCPTDEWESTALVQDQHGLVIPPGTAPGTYHLEVAWFAIDGGQPLYAELNLFRADRVSLAEVMVLPNGSSQEPWDLPNPLQVTFGGELTLLGYEPALVQLQLGGNLLLETYWRAERTPSADHVLTIELVDSRGQAVTSSSSVLVPTYPTSLWKAGQYLRGQQRLAVPLTPGDYSFRVALASPENGPLEASGQAAKPARLLDGELILATVEVLDRPRRFDLPPVTNALEANVGKQAHLMGYDLDLEQARPGGQLLLTLYWQAEGPMVRPFKVFTHLLDSEGTIQAQHDAAPGGGCCPAHTWVEGEVIVDEHPIALGADLSSGTYWLVAGMYDEEHDSREPAYDADGHALAHDRIELAEVTIEAPPVEQDQVILSPREDLDWTLFLPLVYRESSPR